MTIKNEYGANILGQRAWSEINIERIDEDYVIDIEDGLGNDDSQYSSITLTLKQARQLAQSILKDISDEAFCKLKTEAALKPYEGGWNNPLQEAIERIAYHAHMFDARDLSAFRYICDLANRYKDLCK